MSGQPLDNSGRIKAIISKIDDCRTNLDPETTKQKQKCSTIFATRACDYGRPSKIKSKLCSATPNCSGERIN